MVADFTKSPEGVEEYRKLDLQYPNHLQDELYEKWLSETNADNLNKYTHHKEKELTSIHIRLVQEEPGQKPKAFLQYDYMHRRLDVACNVVHRYRPRIGLYPIPRPHWKVTQMSFGKEERKIDFIEGVETGYSIKATKANFQKIISDIVSWPKDGKVGLGIITTNGLGFTIRTSEDFISAIDDPQSFIPVSQQVLSDIARSRTESNLPEKPVTASQVQEMLNQNQRQEQQKQEQEQEQQSKSKQKGNGKENGGRRDKK